jgi:hypothetical protein
MLQKNSTDPLLSTYENTISPESKTLRVNETARVEEKPLMQKKLTIQTENQ